MTRAMLLLCLCLSACSAPPRAPDPHRCAKCGTAADTMEVATVEVYNTQFRRFKCLACGKRWAVVK